MGTPEILAWSLIHFLWQGCLLGGLAWLALRFMKGAAPEARYAVACLGLAAMLAAPAGTALVLRRAAAAPAVVPARSLDTARDVQVDLEAAVPAPPSLKARLQPALPWILGAWGLGVALLSLRLLGGWVWMQRLRYGRAIRAAEEWQVLVRVLSRRIGLARDVLLLVCDRIESPVALGWIRPVILIPPAVLAGLEPLALEAILLHELAHVRRQDYLVNLLQSFAETLLFYHPAVWWLSAAIRQERENACDDTAIRLTGDAVAYARTLSLLEEFRMDTHARLSATQAPAAAGGSLIQRVRRILAPAPAAAPLAPRAAALGLLAAGLLGAATVAPAPKPAPRDAAPNADEPPAEKKTVKKVVVLSTDGKEGAKEGGGVKLRLKLQGDAKLEDIRKDFSRMGPGSSVRITEKGRTFSAERSKEGAYTETYTVDGKNEPITGDARAWAQSKLPEKLGAHTGHGVKVFADGEGGQGEKRVIILQGGGKHGDGPHVLKFKHGGEGAEGDKDFDFDFDFEPGDFQWTPEMKEKMAKLHKELGGKLRIEMKEFHKLPGMQIELEKLHKELGDGKMKTFVFRGGDGDFTWDEGHGREAGQKARMKALKSLAGSLAKDAEDPETKAALGRIQAEIEALEAKAKK